MTKFDSTPKVIPYSDERVFGMLSDFSNIDKIRDHIQKNDLEGNFFNTHAAEDKVKDFSFDGDTCRFSVAPLGKVCFRIIGREPNKTIKYEMYNSFVPMNIWIQLKRVGATDTRMKMTVNAELNPIIKPMISKFLQEFIEKIATILVFLPY
jgi:hypothetical protein